MTGYPHAVHSLLYSLYHARGGGFASAVRGRGSAVAVHTYPASTPTQSLVNRHHDRRRSYMIVRFHNVGMKPTTWKGAIVGICCLIVPLWLVPELVIDFFSLEKPFEYRRFVDITGYVSLVTLFLVIGSIGMGLLTGEYHEHRRAFHWIWLVVGAIAVITLWWSWTTGVGTR